MPGLLPLVDCNGITFFVMKSEDKNSEVEEFVQKYKSRLSSYTFNLSDDCKQEKLSGRTLSIPTMEISPPSAFYIGFRELYLRLKPQDANKLKNCEEVVNKTLEVKPLKLMAFGGGPAFFDHSSSNQELLPKKQEEERRECFTCVML